MKTNLAEIASFLRVEATQDARRPETFVFELPRPEGRIRLAIHTDRSEIDVDVHGSGSAVLFSTSFQCASIVICNPSSRKMAPSVEMVLEGSSIEVHSFFIGGPPHYHCDFLYFDIK